MHHTVRPLQSPALSFILSRQAAIFKKRDSFSEDFIRLSAYTLGSIVLLFFIVSLFFFWNISQEKAIVKQQQLVGESLIREKKELKSQRDELLAKPRLVALAAAQLDLHIPAKDQEYNLY